MDHRGQLKQKRSLSLENRAYKEPPTNVQVYKGLGMEGRVAEVASWSSPVKQEFQRLLGSYCIYTGHPFEQVIL